MVKVCQNRFKSYKLLKIAELVMLCFVTVFTTKKQKCHCFLIHNEKWFAEYFSIFHRISCIKQVLGFFFK